MTEAVINNLSAGQLAKYRKRNQVELKKAEEELKAARSERMKAKNQIHYTDQLDQLTEKEVLAASKVKRLKSISAQIRKRSEELARPRTPAQSTMKLLSRLNTGHRKAAENKRAAE